MQAEIVILGSGTSMGVPTLGCDCRVCTSPDPRDARLRPSIAIQWPDHCVLIDTGPDFRVQVLRERIRHIDAVFYTHAHADHILGLDDLRPLSFGRPDKIPLYADNKTGEVLERVFDYTFSPDSPYPNKARVELHRIEGTEEAIIAGASFQRIPVQHGRIEIAGFRFGSAAYLTDMSSISDESIALLSGVEIVILDALRKEPHPSHANLPEALAWAEKIGARQAWFTHMSHDLPHEETNRELPPNMRLAYDGLRIPFEL
ncbi:MBL fold metallo-hydrolase [Acidipila rosea]|uniref:Phosphoribosyl 1,2-cyclic phosphate phosphodiesterase n=1 Tax=Acidipila rosea TaxID=768535 RepID=A0A4R1L919_9BACT|nr:MBL fold metallo-hydrolase [Acidipila rosea]MBW4026828.1 MBL fold metallo-hydrolase [Acidobacteriota bacterium]MBW4043407.1 MBL fold metallo-hydrolase [Acidobacteriota bacterium]TCK73710.1 phosphoribosyl 1,2-cyclic phosphate phosphodiesterase [Acidipila rosea]